MKAIKAVPIKPITGSNWKAVFIGCLIVLAGCQTTTVPNNPNGFHVRKPMGFVDIQVRRTELKAIGEDRYLLCPSAGPYDIDPSPVKVVGHGTKYTILNQPNPFNIEIYFIENMINGWLVEEDPKFLDSLKAWLLASADAKSLTKLIPDPDKFRYIDPLFNLRFVLKPIFVGFDVLRQEGHMSEDEEKRIRTWLEDVVKESDKGRCESRNYCDPPNHTTLHRGTTFMLWGAVSGSDYWFNKGIDHYLEAISALRSDGSNAQDVVRKRKSGSGGSRGLRKQNQVVGYLVMAAELAKIQGYDLYGASSGEKSLFTAFDFLVRGIEDNSVVAQHTGSDFHGTPFLYRSKHNDETVAWFEIFARRFPNHPLTAQFAKHVTADRPLSSPAYGGNLSCLFGDPASRVF